MRTSSRLHLCFPGQEHIEWQLILDTSDESGFLREPKKLPSGEDVAVNDRSAMLLKLVGGSQAQARKESWKKRAIEIPRESKTPPPVKKKKDAPASA